MGNPADQKTQVDSTEQETWEVFKGGLPEQANGAVAAVFTANVGPTVLSGTAILKWVTITLKDGLKAYFPVWR